MTRYFFHTADGSRERDTEGTELPDHHAARVEAIMLTGAIMKESPGVLWGGDEFCVEVTDEAGVLLFTIFTSAVDTPAAGKTAK